MILDGLLTFTGTGNGSTAGITAGQWTDLPTTGTQDASTVIDLGLVGIPSFANGGGARDLGIGDDPSMKLYARVVTAVTGGTNITLELQGAPDNGSGAEGSYTVMWKSPAVVLEAALIAGCELANVDIPRAIFEQVLPRFLKLTFVSVGTHSAGAIQAGIVIDRDDQIISSAGKYSGYPAGVTVAN